MNRNLCLNKNYINLHMSNGFTLKHGRKATRKWAIGLYLLRNGLTNKLDLFIGVVTSYGVSVI